MFKTKSFSNCFKDKLLSKSELLSVKGGTEPPTFEGGDGGGGNGGGNGTNTDLLAYCGQLYAIISCNPGSAAQASMYFNQHGCNNGSPGVTYWNSAMSQGIPMNSPGCNTSWYSY